MGLGRNAHGGNGLNSGSIGNEDGFLECFFLFFLQARVSRFRYSSPLYNEKWNLVESFKENLLSIHANLFLLECVKI